MDMGLPNQQDQDLPAHVIYLRSSKDAKGELKPVHLAGMGLFSHVRLRRSLKLADTV